MLSEGKTIAEVCQQLEVVEATFHRWWNPPSFIYAARFNALSHGASKPAEAGWGSKERDRASADQP